MRIPSMNEVLLTPITPSLRADLGRKPHRRYRIVRGKFEEIVRARDELKLSDRQAARAVGLRGAKEFAEAYELLKRNGEPIVLHNDWTGVEEAIYALFPHYQRDPQFHALLDEFKDTRPREQAAPVLPVQTAATPPAEAPMAPVPTTAPAGPGSAGEGAPAAVALAPSLDTPTVIRKWGKPTARDPLVVAAELAKAAAAKNP